MRFRHKPNTITSRDYPGGLGPAAPTYVVNQGEAPPQGGNPTVRKGYKEIHFSGGFPIETNDPETIEFLRRQPQVECLDDMPQSKTYTPEELDRLVEARVTQMTMKRNTVIATDSFPGKTVAVKERETEPVLTSILPSKHICECGFVAKNHLGLFSHKKHCKVMNAK